MDLKKLIGDIFKGNTSDLSARVIKLRALIYRMWRNAFSRDHFAKNLTSIPVVINNRNRLTYMLMLIEWLEKVGMKNIVILDNDSTYPPLLEYYSACKHRVVFLRKNVGPRAMWETAGMKEFCTDYYIYTDADVVPVESASIESIRLMYAALKKNPFLEKVGFALRIDDLPDHFKLKRDVISWESKFWQKPQGKDYFDAPVDTTFALYAPFATGGGECKAFRTNFPHVARHMPWYENSSEPSAEHSYYQSHAADSSSHWTRLIPES